MDDTIKRDVNAILHSLGNDDRNAPDSEEEQHEPTTQEPIRHIHIYIETPEEGTATVESDLVTPTPDAQTQEQEDIQGQKTQPVAEAPQRRRRVPLFVVLLVCVCCGVLTLSLGYLYVLPLVAPSATVNLVAETRQLTTSNTITLVTGTASTDQGELAARAVSSGTINQARTVATTGTGHQDARAASGTITFYNAAPTIQQLPAGTLITGKNGIQVLTDQDVTIPAAIYPTFGEAHVSAHAAAPGPTGNSAAGDIYGPCCRLNLSAVSGPFTGGQDARTYPLVTQQDIETVASSLKTTVMEQESTALHGQVKQDESLLTLTPCNPVVTSDHQPGTEAQQVTITVTITCTGIIYNTQSYQSLATQLSMQDVTKQVGTHYALNGDMHISTTQTSVKADNVAVQIQCSGTWVYQFDQSDFQRLKHLIAGKSKEQAVKLLTHQEGVKRVTVDETDATIPTDTAHIHVLVMYPAHGEN